MIRAKSALAVLREQKNQTQMELATLLGISQAKLSMYETGQIPPTPTIVDAVGKLYPDIEEPADLFLSYIDFVDKYPRGE
jgi:transcriptional regulator with XRE-family HTH domain